MSSRAEPRRSAIASGLYGLLNPIPFGCFVAALIFDTLYLRSGVVLWNKGAAWLIVFGLLFAVIPRLINLVQVWITSRVFATRIDRQDFLLNLFAVIAAIFNAFVHSRDADAVMPAGEWLSVCTVVFLSISHLLVAVQSTRLKGGRP